MGPLAGVKVIFDGVMFRIHHGRMFGINKMWSNIVPFMAKAVRSLGGTFTHCQSSWADEYGNMHVHELEETQNEPLCDQDLTSAVQQLKGEYTLVFSSYFRRPMTAESDNVCYFLPVYDFTPEILNSYHGQPPEFYMKNDSIANANGFLSLSDSTTCDLLDLHPFVDAQYVATSPNRVSASFGRVPASTRLDMQGLEDGDLLELRLESRKPFILLLGYTEVSPKYKGYALFWEAILRMPEAFKEGMAVLVIGGMPPIDELNMDVTAVAWVPEDMLPHLYSRAAVFVYPSFLEGFGMPPIEAVACGCPVILGPFYKTRMQHYFGSDALYVMNVADMMDALTRVQRGDVASSDALIARARVLGGNARHGWNAVARDYLVVESVLCCTMLQCVAVTLRLSCDRGNV